MTLWPEDCVDIVFDNEFDLNEKPQFMVAKRETEAGGVTAALWE